MATQSIEQLKARVEAQRHELLTNDRDPQRFFILDPDVRKLTCVVGGTAADVEAWCEERERDQQIARGLVPEPGTQEGENGFYTQPTLRERREAIVRTGDAALAIGEVGATMHAVNGMGRMLQQDTIRDEGDWVLSIAHMLVEESDRMIEFLDRAGGWNGRAG